ncbi:MAG: DUF2291 family protein [Opitutaceae bacterium]|nr:DUF2291 family protein [Opitutaceae bacterium]
MAGSSEQSMRRGAGVACVVLLVALLWFFPLFRVVPLNSTHGTTVTGAATTTFDPAAVAARLWSTELPTAAQRAADAATVAADIRANPEVARKKHGGSAGLGTAYYFVRGTGKVVSLDRNYLRLRLAGSSDTLVALRVGPVFGNVVRDGCGLLDVNKVPGLQEYNALAAELNALVEKNVQPHLRQAGVGASVTFAGCSEAPETAAAPGEPILNIVPVLAEIQQ